MNAGGSTHGVGWLLRSKLRELAEGAFVVPADATGRPDLGVYLNLTLQDLESYLEEPGVGGFTATLLTRLT